MNLKNIDACKRKLTRDREATRDEVRRGGARREGARRGVMNDCEKRETVRGHAVRGGEE